MVLAADKLFMSQGLTDTTLSQIAVEADVPLGNVYYYYKRKEDIALAVLEYKQKQMHELLEHLSEHPEPKARLQSLVRHCLNQEQEANNKFSNLLVTFVNDANKCSEEFSNRLVQIVNGLIVWCTKQFESLNKGERSEKYALQLFLSLQGLLLNEGTINAFHTDGQIDFLAEQLDFS